MGRWWYHTICRAAQQTVCRVLLIVLLIEKNPRATHQPQHHITLRILLEWVNVVKVVVMLVFVCCCGCSRRGDDEDDVVCLKKAKPSSVRGIYWGIRWSIPLFKNFPLNVSLEIGTPPNKGETRRSWVSRFRIPNSVFNARGARLEKEPIEILP